MLRKVDEQNHAKVKVVSVEASDQVLVKAQVVLFSAIPGIAAHESTGCDGMPLGPPRRECKAPSPPGRNNLATPNPCWPWTPASGRLGDLTYQATPLYSTETSQWPPISTKDQMGNTTSKGSQVQIPLDLIDLDQRQWLPES